jgi:hypothetical protein
VSSPVPRTFHFVFGLREQTEPFSLVFYLALRSCLTVNRPDRLLFHCLHEPWGPYWELIRDEVTVMPVALVDDVTHHAYDELEVPAMYRYAHHADFIRLDVLIEHGGVYADIDTIFVSPIPDALYDRSFVIGREAPVHDTRTGVERPSLCNALLMAEPGARFAREWRQRMPGALAGWSHHSTLLPQVMADEHPALVHVEPERTFYPYRWSPLDLHRLFEAAETDVDGICSIHLWSHLWWDERRVDFSAFHAGLITEDAVRTVDSTYNLLARRHLPA